MENNNMEKKEGMEGSKHCEGCGMMGKGAWHYEHSKMRFLYLLRVLVMLIILIIVFMCGFRLGSLTSMLRSGSRRTYPMMQQGEYSNVQSGQGQRSPMMPVGGTVQGSSTPGQEYH
jgi:hypothetical protein